MNEFYLGVIKSLLTKALTGVSVYLVTNGWLSQDQTTQLTIGLVGLVASVLVSVWQRYGDALLKNAALQLTDPDATMNDAKALAKTDAVAPATQAPDVAPKPMTTTAVRRLLTLLLAGSMIVPSLACGKKPAVLVGQAGVISVDSIYEIHRAVVALNLPADKERPIQRALFNANEKLAPVPDLIIAIDNATKAGESATTDTEKAFAYLTEAAKYLDTVNGDLQAVPTAAAAMVLVGKVQTAIATVLRAIEQVKTSTPKAQRVTDQEVAAALRVLYAPSFGN